MALPWLDRNGHRLRRGQSLSVTVAVTVCAALKPYITLGLTQWFAGACHGVLAGTCDPATACHGHLLQALAMTAVRHGS